MRRSTPILLTTLLSCFARGAVPTLGAEPLTVGSKVFTESVVLGEIATQALERAGVASRHRRELGGTRVLWNALLAGEIDVYAEYTGTIREEILAGKVASGNDALRAALAARGIEMSASLGFSNTYALGTPRRTAERLGLRRISDLVRHPQLRFGVSNEFLARADGWPGLAAAYGLSATVRGLAHDLAYRALAAGEIDLTDLYSTDAEIRAHDLVVLVDDRAYFPDYSAVWLSRSDLGKRAPAAVEALRRLEGKIDGTTMTAMNAGVRLDGLSEAGVASDFLSRLDGSRASAPPAEMGRLERLGRRTLEHLLLVGLSLVAAMIVAIPLGLLAAKRPVAGQLILGITGILQTVPSLALLVLMIPVLGIGAGPAIAALFLYGLLPIVRNTATGLRGIPPALSESALALGLPAATRLRRIELPLASPAILAGIQTAAVINVGTATLGALVGAGGYGQPILTGIRLADTELILEGALPAAVLALALQGLFELLAHHVLPRGLRRRNQP